MKRIKVFTAFSGYDSQLMALRRLETSCPDIRFDLVGWCEIDATAVRSHNAVFPEYAQPFNSDIATGFWHPDITKVEWEKVPDFDILFYSSCCQDLTRTGKQRGMEEGSGTRSALIWECLDAIRIKRPQYCVLENVPGMVEENNIISFNKWQRSVDRLGYRSYWKVLSAADFGIPQNRKRLLMVSIRSDISLKYQFPKPINCPEINSVGKNGYIDNSFFLDSSVNEKYYLDASRVSSFIYKICNKKQSFLCSKLHNSHMVEHIITPTCLVNENVQIIPTITATAYENATDENCYTLAYYPKPMVFEVWESDFKVDVYKNFLDLTVSRKAKKITNACSNLIRCKIDNLTHNQYCRLRRMTPRELFLFMGVSETDIGKLLKSGNNDAELYKQAGNSIVVDVLFHVFRELFIDHGFE